MSLLAITFDGAAGQNISSLTLSKAGIAESSGVSVILHPGKALSWLLLFSHPPLLPPTYRVPHYSPFSVAGNADVTLLLFPVIRRCSCVTFVKFNSKGNLGNEGLRLSQVVCFSSDYYHMVNLNLEMKKKGCIFWDTSRRKHRKCNLAIIVNEGSGI